MSTDLLESWPYFREHPDLIRLDVVEGVQPSDKPPVRIFLGTEDGQYRAERIFVYTIVKHRDPARIYEIYLMKNLTGFDRRAWRTGFTMDNYKQVLQGAEGQPPLTDFFVNSFVIVIPAVLLPLLLASLAAYAFAWIDFPFRNALFVAVFALQTVLWPLAFLLLGWILLQKLLD